MNKIYPRIGIALTCFSIVALFLFRQSSPLIAQQGALELIWQLELDEKRQSRIYETLILPNGEPDLIATTSDEVLLIQNGDLRTLFPLRHVGARGQSPVLPASLAVEDPGQIPIGILNHQHHNVFGMQIVSLDGETRMRLDDTRNFHYRLGPDAKTFVGIDANYEHTAWTADAITYHFYTMDGREVPSETIRVAGAQPRMDSAYSPDGRIFYINSRQEGILAVDPQEAVPLWQSSESARFFAPANADSRLLIAADATKRNVALLYEEGDPRWAFSLEEVGAVDNVRNVAISPSGEFSVVTGKHHLVILQADSPEPLTLFESGDELTINSVAVTDKGIVAVGAQQAQIADNESTFGHIWLLTQDGELLFETEIKHQRSNAWIPTVQFDMAGRFLHVRTLEQLALYALQ